MILERELLSSSLKTKLFKEENGHIQATVPTLPECMVKAPTRSEAISTIRKAISEIISRIEIIQI